MTGRLAPAGWVVAVTGLLLLAACAEAAPDTGSDLASGPGTPTPSELAVDPDLEAPPPVTVRFSDQAIDLAAWTYCYRTSCVDGIPPAEPPDVGSPEEVIVEYPLPGWSFTASFRPAGDECGREQDAPLEPAAGGAFVLRPVGYAGTYDVSLFGVGDGDLMTTFRWTTPVDGPLPEPEARLALLAESDGQITSFGVELSLVNLARTPAEATATITIQAQTGDEASFEAQRAAGGCAPTGSVYWDGPRDTGFGTAAASDGPFTYRVELELDGDRYLATATWPDDEIAGNEPSVALHFVPELPAL
jgi:hypothetical protein